MRDFFLVLLLCPVLYGACDSGSSSSACREKLDPVLLALETPTAGSALYGEVKSFVFTTGATAVDYTITLSGKTNTLSWGLYTYRSDCFDDYSSADVLAGAADTYVDPEEVTFSGADRLEADTEYFLRYFTNAGGGVAFTVTISD